MTSERLWMGCIPLKSAKDALWGPATLEALGSSQKMSLSSGRRKEATFTQDREALWNIPRKGLSGAELRGFVVPAGPPRVPGGRPAESGPESAPASHLPPVGHRPCLRARRPGAGQAPRPRATAQQLCVLELACF